jgi:hypothetical protein
VLWGRGGPADGGEHTVIRPVLGTLLWAALSWDTGPETMTGASDDSGRAAPSEKKSL